MLLKAMDHRGQGCDTAGKSGVVTEKDLVRGLEKSVLLALVQKVQVQLRDAFLVLGCGQKVILHFLNFQIDDILN